MQESLWQKVNKWLKADGQSSQQVQQSHQAIRDVEHFFSVAGPFVGWDKLSPQDGMAYLTALARTLDSQQLPAQWTILDRLSEALYDLGVNSRRPFDPTHLFTTALADERGYSPATIKAYSTDLRDCRRVLKKAGSTHQWSEIDHHDVNLYLMDLKRRHLKQSTILRKLSSLRTFYQFLEQNHLVKSNPWELVVMKRQPAALPRYLYPPEIKALIKTARGKGEELDYRNVAIVQTLLGTGMRVGELCQLQVNQVDDSLNVILVNGKGGKQRYLPLGGEVKKALLAYQQRCRTPLMRRYHRDHQYLFVNQYGEKITPAGVTYVLNELIERSSLTGHIHPHMLRHTFATAMLNNGADIRSVQELLGHASLSTTQIYTHLTSQHLQDSYQRFFSRARKD